MENTNEIRNDLIECCPAPGWRITDLLHPEIASILDKIERESVTELSESDDKPKTSKDSELSYNTAVSNAKFAPLAFAARITQWPVSVELTEEAAALFYTRYHDFCIKLLDTANKLIEAERKAELASLLLGVDGTTHPAD